MGVAVAMFLLAGVGWTQPLVLSGAGGPTKGVSAVVRTLPRRFWVWIGFALLYGVCETLFGNWGSVYLHQQRGLPSATANLALAVF